MEKIISRIIAQRKANGLTQKEMAKRLGIAQVNYGKVETGKTELTVNRLLKIAEALGINVMTLINPDFKEVEIYEKLLADNLSLKKEIENLKIHLEKQSIINNLQSQIIQNIKNGFLEAHHYFTVEINAEISSIIDDVKTKNSVLDSVNSASQTHLNNLKEWLYITVEDVQRSWEKVKQTIDSKMAGKNK